MTRLFLSYNLGMNITQIDRFMPIQREFRSTKELYCYAKNKIIACAKNKKKEYLIIADTKNNKILYEKLGNRDSVDISNFVFPEKEKQNITVIHGHVTRNGSPLSVSDCLHLCHHKYEKIIAFNKKGRFALFQIKPNSNINEASRFFRYGILFRECPFLPKSFVKKWFVLHFGNIEKRYENWVKQFLEKPNMNFRYSSTMFK